MKTILRKCPEMNGSLSVCTEPYLCMYFWIVVAAECGCIAILHNEQFAANV